jgi:hypothetical protein
MYKLRAPGDVPMTQIIVLGDSGIGKTAFMIIATGQRMPHNVFRSRQAETFHMCSAAFTIVPGAASPGALGHACEGADGILVLCKRGDSSRARAWLHKVECMSNSGLHVPVIVCAHGGQGEHRLREDDIRLLRRYPTAEYAFTCHAWPEGIKDCANRIVHRVRRTPTTPIHCEL